MEDNQRNIKKRRRDIILIVIAVLAVLLIGIYIWGVIYYHSHFFPRTFINGINVGGQDVSQATESISKDMSSRQLVLQGEGGKSDTITGTEIGLKFDNAFGDMERLMNEQDEFFWEMHLISRDNVELNTHYYYDDNKLFALVDSLNIVTGQDVHEPENAKVSYNGTEWVVDPAVHGNLPNKERLQKAIIEGLVNNEKVIHLENSGIYEEPALNSDDPTLVKDAEDLNNALKAVITINFPKGKVTLNRDTFASWLGLNGNTPIVNDEPLNAYVADLAKQNNTSPNVSFTARDGRTYNFKTDTYWELNQAEQASQIKEKILAGANESINPTWSRQGSGYITSNTLRDNYIEVSLAQQTLWTYKNNSLLMNSLIVSGNVSSRQTTSTGLFFIQSKDQDVNINVRQPDGNVKTNPVKYWLPFTQNLGIESATWRSDFGGSIYQNQGTDGDIELPQNSAQTIFNNIEVGFPVVIY